MSDPSDNAAFEMALNRLGVRLPPADIEQLRRAFQRQRTALRSWEEQVVATTEPAHAFSLRDFSSGEPPHLPKLP
jgi:hypothetical protein